MARPTDQVRIFPEYSNPFVLGSDQVHVWSSDLRLTPKALVSCQSTLSEDELARAARFSFARDRDRYVAGRGQLRMLLGRYAGIEPSRIGLAYGPQGKPAMLTRTADLPLEFNLTHCEDLVLYSFCLNRRLGIDVERVRQMPDADALAGRFFSRAERDWLASLGAADKAAAFFQIWTCKEALLKAVGSGLTRPLNETEVMPDVSGSLSLISIDGDQAATARWRLHIFVPVPGFRAALAVEGANLALVRRQFHGS